MEENDNINNNNNNNNNINNNDSKTAALIDKLKLLLTEQNEDDYVSVAINQIFNNINNKYAL